MSLSFFWCFFFVGFLLKINHNKLFITTLNKTSYNDVEYKDIVALSDNVDVYYEANAKRER